MNKADIIQFLKEQGYYTESLHSIDDVQKEFKCSQEEAIKRIKDSLASNNFPEKSSKISEYTIRDVDLDNEYPLNYYDLNYHSQKGQELVSVVSIKGILRYYFKLR
jgi:hypothetical protein